MDAVGIGVFIGVSIMVCAGISLKLKDVWNQRQVSNQTPLFVLRSHSNVKNILPK